MSIFDYKAEILKLEEAIQLGQISAGGALALLGLKMHEHFAAQLGGPARPVRVSFRKNVEIAPFRHEHAEVTVELNGSSLAEATAVAKDAVDEVLGVKELRTAQEQIENAKRVLRDAAKQRAKRGRRENDPALEDALRWDED